MLKANQFFFPSVDKSLPMKTNRMVYENGVLDWSGYTINNFFSPDDGTTMIEVGNDTGLLPPTFDNDLYERTAQLLWGR